MKFALNLSSRFPLDSRPSGYSLPSGSLIPPPPSPPSFPLREEMRTAVPRGGSGGVGIDSVLVLFAVTHGRSLEWAEGQRLACVGARGRPLRLGLRCLSLQFTSPSARFGVVTFISGSKVLHTLAPWCSGIRRSP